MISPEPWYDTGRTLPSMATPNGDGLPVWTPYTASHRQSMELGAHIGMSDFCGSPRVRFIVDRILSE